MASGVIGTAGQNPKQKMYNKVFVSMVFFDIFVLGLVMLAGVGGYRRGGLKAFFSMFWVYISLICTMVLYSRAAISLQVAFGASSPLSMLISFVLIFAVAFAITRTINIFVVKWVKPVAVESRFGNILGVIFGGVEAILMVGIVFMNIAFYPIKAPLSDSVSFKTLYTMPHKVAEYSLWFAPNLLTSDRPIITPVEQRSIFEEDYGIGESDGKK